MSTATGTTQEIERAIEAMTEAYEARSMDDIMACFAPDADAVLYGTGADEKRIGPAEIRQQVERDWSQTDKAAMSFSWKSIGTSGDVAWAALDGAFDLEVEGQRLSLPARVSLVLEKRDGRWLIVHSHFSTPAASQESGQAF